MYPKVCFSSGQGYCWESHFSGLVQSGLHPN
jgi:hypothetical protein